MAELKIGDKYLVLCVGDSKIPFFPSETKDGKKCFKTSLTIFVNEKQEKQEKNDVL